MPQNSDLYNEDELNPPAWLNNEFLEKVLQKSEQKEVKVTDLVITPGTTKSDHYGSVMFRVKFNYTIDSDDQFAQQQHRSLIVKSALELEGQKKELTKDMQLFETEIQMYSETLPKLEAMLRAIGDETVLCASCLYYTLEPRKCLVFEDLVERGYTTIASRCCTIEEVKTALMKLAKIHATSYKLAQEGDASIASYTSTVYTPEVVQNLDMMKDGVKVFKYVISQHKDLLSYVPYFDKLEHTIVSEILKYFDVVKGRTNNEILVLNHGDFHIKNMMVKLDSNGKLNDLMLLDYQICSYGSLVLDLLYASIMIFSPTMRQRQRQELYYFYFKTFQQTLRKLGYAGHIPTILEFQVELLKHKPWELFLFASFLSGSYMITSENADVAKLCEDAGYRRNIFENPALLQEIRATLPRLLHEGYFEDV